MLSTSSSSLWPKFLHTIRPATLHSLLKEAVTTLTNTYILLLSLLRLGIESIVKSRIAVMCTIKTATKNPQYTVPSQLPLKDITLAKLDPSSRVSTSRKLRSILG